MLPRQGVIAALTNTEKQTQGGCQNEETKKHSPDERTECNSRKITKQNGDDLLDAEFKTGVIRVFNELSGRAGELREDFNSIKKDIETIKENQSEMKDTLTEMKNNLQGNNSRMDEAQNLINDLKHGKTKSNQAKQEEKRI